MMQERISSCILSAICLTITISALFLRNVVYYDLQPSKTNTVFPPQAQANTPIILAYHERPPYYTTTEDNSLGGVVGEIAFSVMQDSGLEFTVKKVPPKRQLNNIRNNSTRICGVGWFINPERQLFARFTEAIYQDKSLSLLTRSDMASIHDGLTLKELITNDNLRLLIKNSYSYGCTVDNLIKGTDRSFFSTVGSSRQMLEMIATDKADYFILASEEAAALLSEDEHPERFKVVRPPDVPPGEKRYLMCSSLVKEKEINRLNEAIKRRADKHRNGNTL